MRRLKAASALVLTAFFAVIGAYHHHSLPRAKHDHVGLCSHTSTAPPPESCATCQATHTVAHRVAAVAVATALDRISPLEITQSLAPTAFDASLLHGSRAPPAV